MNTKQELEYKEWLKNTIKELKETMEVNKYHAEDYRSMWISSNCKDNEFYEKYNFYSRRMLEDSIKLEHLENELNNAKYAIKVVGSDKYCYEILEKKTKSTFVIRRMNCKVENGEEKFYSNEEATEFEIRRKRNLKGFNYNGTKFYLSIEPVEYLDPEF